MLRKRCKARQTKNPRRAQRNKARGRDTAITAITATGTTGCRRSHTITRLTRSMAATGCVQVARWTVNASRKAALLNCKRCFLRASSSAYESIEGITRFREFCSATHSCLAPTHQGWLRTAASSRETGAITTRGKQNRSTEKLPRKRPTPRGGGYPTAAQ